MIFKRPPGNQEDLNKSASWGHFSSFGGALEPKRQPKALKESVVEEAVSREESFKTNLGRALELQFGPLGA